MTTTWGSGAAAGSGAGCGSGAGGVRPLRISATITASLTPAPLSCFSVGVSIAKTPRSTSISASSTWSLRPAFDNSMTSRMVTASARRAVRVRRVMTVSRARAMRRNIGSTLQVRTDQLYSATKAPAGWAGRHGVPAAGAAGGSCHEDSTVPAAWRKYLKTLRIIADLRGTPLAHSGETGSRLHNAVQTAAGSSPGARVRDGRGGWRLCGDPPQFDGCRRRAAGPRRHVVGPGQPGRVHPLLFP